MNGAEAIGWAVVMSLKPHPRKSTCPLSRFLSGMRASRIEHVLVE